MRRIAILRRPDALAVLTDPAFAAALGILLCASEEGLDIECILSESWYADLPWDLESAGL